MFKIVGCSEETFGKIAKYCKSDGDLSQETLSFIGITMAYMQPNMIGERGDPDFYWCRRFLKWFI